MAAKRTFTPEAIAAARERYENTDEPVADIAAALRIEVGTLYRYMRKWGWQLRSERGPQDLSPLLREAAATRKGSASGAIAAPAPPTAAAHTPRPEAPPSAAASVPRKSPNIAARLERAIRKQLAAIERAQAGSRGTPRSAQEAERLTRMLAVLARALKEAQSLRAQASPVPDDDDDFPADIDELRRELARRIHAFVESRADRPVREAGEQGDDESPAV